MIGLLFLTMSHFTARTYGSYSSSRSYSSYSRSYSSPRTSSTRSYSSTRTSTPKTTKTYSSSKSTSTKPSTRTYNSRKKTTSSAPKRTYTASRTPITRSNLTQRTTYSQRTTVINHYHSDMYGYHSYFHPFGWGYGGGDFWFWMWMFDNNGYHQNQQIIQASNVSVTTHPSSFWADALLIAAAIAMIALVWAFISWTRRHILYV